MKEFNIEQLKIDYGVASKTDLIKAQFVHIERLQLALSCCKPVEWTLTKVREG